MTQSQDKRRGSGAFGTRVVVRWALTIFLTLAVVVHVAMVPAGFAQADQSLRYYVVNAAVDLVPALIYGLAVLFVLAGRAARLAWGILLACGIALSAVVSYYLVTTGFGELMLAPVCLVALSLLQLFWRPAAPASRLETGRRSL